MRYLLPLLALSACSADATEDSGGTTADSGYTADESTEVLSDGGSYYLSYTSEPSPIPYNEYFTLSLQVSDGEDPSLPVTGASVSVDAIMPQHGHGMNTTPTVTDGGDGRFTVDGMLFHMQGLWQILVTVDGEAGVEGAIFEVDCCQ